MEVKKWLSRFRTANVSPSLKHLNDKEKLYKEYQKLNDFLRGRHTDLEEHLGAGQFGTVFKGNQGDEVAVKFQLSTLLKQGVTTCYEVIFLKSDKGKSPYIVPLIDVFFDSDKKVIIQVFEYQAGGDLHKLIQESDGGLSEGQAARFYLQIGSGLSFAHQEGIAHRNLKPRNILLDATRTIARISDFGQSEFIYNFHTGTTVMKLRENIGTPNYLPPEYMSEDYEKHRTDDSPLKADVWGMGVIMFEMVYGFLPWKYEQLLDLSKQPIATVLWPQDKQTSREFMDFIVRHFVLDPHQRQHIWVLLIDPFLTNGMNYPAVYKPEDELSRRNHRLTNQFVAENRPKPLTEVFSDFNISPEGRPEIPILINEFQQRGYEIRRYLGQGAFAYVYGGKYQNKLCAVKVPIPEKLDKITDDIIRELTNLKKINHPNVVRIYDVFFVQRIRAGLIMTLEYSSGGDLGEYLASKPDGLPEAEAARFYLQMANGLQYCHMEGVTHKDLKPGNVLLDGTQTVCKLSDLGLSDYLYERQTGEKNTKRKVTGTMQYLPPEDIFETENLGETKGDPCKSDVWAMGVIMFQMVYNYYPFWIDPEDVFLRWRKWEDAYEATKKLDDLPWHKKNITEKFKMFVSRHWEFNFADRPTIAVLMVDPFLNIAHSYPLIASGRHPTLALEDFERQGQHNQN